MSNVFNERQQSLMEKALNIKVKMLDSYDKSNLSGETISDDSIDKGIALADSVERSIERTVKLNLVKDKIEVDRQNGTNMADAFIQLHALRLKELRNTPPEEILKRTELKELDVDRIGGELLEGELLTGEDTMDFDKYVSTRGSDRD